MVSFLLLLDNVAEWSKAPALGAGLARGVGSNPTVVIGFLFHLHLLCDPAHLMALSVAVHARSAPLFFFSCFLLTLFSHGVVQSIAA